MTISRESAEATFLNGFDVIKITMTTAAGLLGNIATMLCVFNNGLYNRTALTGI